jgi:two-component system nitrate/nitrite response regulator NarL
MGSRMTIRLVLADDHPIILAGLVQLFSAEGDFEILARAGNGEDTLRAVLQFRPDILVLDIRMPGMDGLAVLREMRGRYLPTKVVVLTAIGGDPIFEAVRLGARGVLLKDAAPQLLVRCIREVHAGGNWLEHGIASNAVDRLLKRESEIRTIEQTLTRRELEVARLIAQGLSSKAVARRLGIGDGTAKLHLHHVYEKLKLEGRVALSRYIQIHGID